MLIGGNGADDLQGGKDEDLLISGSTLYDTYIVGLRLILSEWSATVRTFDQRVANLRIGAGPILIGTGIKLTATGTDRTIFNDNSSDKLKGDKGRDWFFANLANDSNDKKNEDLLDSLL